MSRKTIRIGFPASLKSMFSKALNEIIARDSTFDYSPEKYETFIHQPGFKIANRFEVQQVIQGGMGIVYICYDHLTHSKTVFKTLRPEFSRNLNAIERFKEEALTWVSLGQHEHIVFASRLAFHEDKPHIMLEYIEPAPGFGIDLRSRIKSGPLTLEQTLRYAIHICSGMDYINKKFPGIVHRDLKPENILINPDDIAKVTDFGLVKTLDNVSAAFLTSLEKHSVSSKNLTQIGNIVGTTYYIPPEQCLGKTTDQRSDIYSFGCILFEMITGRLVFENERNGDYLYCHIEKKAEPVSKFADNIPDELVQLIQKCLQKSPAERHQSFAQLLSDLQKIKTKGSGREDRSKNPEEDKPESNLINPEITVWINRAITLSNMKRMSEAEECYQKGLEIDPDDAFLWINRAINFAAMGQADDAFWCFDKAIFIYNEHKKPYPPQMLSGIYFNKGYLFDNMREFDNALECYDQAIIYNPEDHDIYLNKGIILSHRKDDAAALACFDQAINLFPDFAKAYNAKGNVYSRQRDFTKAMDCFERALDIDPSLETARENLFRCINSM